jgi:(R,R)-butanediol dehydrogenase/meso-butanediol dehydrogenase/diacetyl reductase/L-iditol 2-dehydrogenase
MKAAILKGIGLKTLTVEDVPEPQPGPDQVKVKIAYCGLCGTDPENIEGRFGLIPREAYDKPQQLGHEASGTIVAAGKNIKNYQVGQRVACDFKGACGKCYFCRNKMEHFCTNPDRASGSFAEYAVYPESAIYALPDGISLEEGCFLEPVSVAVHAIDIAGVRPGGMVAISGAGPIGLLCLQVALKAGAARVMVSEPVAGKREVAQRLGADITADPYKEDLEKLGLKLTDGLGFDTVIEASSDLKAARQAISLAGKCGTVLWAAVYPVEAEIGVPPFTMYAKELTIRSVFVSPYCFPRALNLIPRLDIKSLITNIMPLKDIKKAFELHETRKAIKILIQP